MASSPNDTISDDKTNRRTGGGPTALGTLAYDHSLSAAFIGCESAIGL